MQLSLSWEAPARSSRGIDWAAVPLGVVPDREIARRLGVTQQTVWKLRTQRGIPPAPKTSGVTGRAAKKTARKAERRRSAANAKRLFELGTVGRVYFIRSGQAIKIGWTAGPVEQRLRQMQPSNPEPMEVVGVMEECDVAAERRLHRQFDDIRIANEWFVADPKLLGYIAKHARAV